MSSSRKALKVLSILMIVFSIMMLLLGLLMCAGMALPGLASESVTVEGESINLAAGALVIGIMFLILGVIDLIIGFLGVRGAKNPAKIGPFWVLCIIGIVGDVLSLIGTASSGGDVSSIVVNLIFIIILFALANNIKKENA